MTHSPSFKRNLFTYDKAPHNLTIQRFRLAHSLAAVSLAEIMPSIGTVSGTVPGTFDPRDLASHGVSAFLESMTYDKITRRSVL